MWIVFFETYIINDTFNGFELSNVAVSSIVKLDMALLDDRFYRVLLIRNYNFFFHFQNYLRKNMEISKNRKEIFF